MPDRLRLPLRFDPARMAADIERLANVDWTRHFVRQNYDGDWSAIALRSPRDAKHPIMMISARPGCDDYVDTRVLAGAPYLREVLAAFACPLRSVRLMRLGPGSVIKEHTDLDLSYEDGAVRLHVPIMTNEGVAFRLNGREVAMAPGETWYLRLTDPHAVENRGITARIHLVLDAVVDAWVEAIFAQACTAAGAAPA